jgi:hypothetical protein
VRFFPGLFGFFVEAVNHAGRDRPFREVPHPVFLNAGRAIASGVPVGTLVRRTPIDVRDVHARLLLESHVSNLTPQSSRHRQSTTGDTRAHTEPVLSTLSEPGTSVPGGERANAGCRAESSGDSRPRLDPARDVRRVRRFRSARSLYVRC